MVMHIELRCPRCPCRFSAAPATPASEVLDRMTDDGPWFALASGETFQEMLMAALRARGRIRCPECGTAVAVGGKPPGRYSLAAAPCC
jgi:hypothetical protein